MIRIEGYFLDGEFILEQQTTVKNEDQMYYIDAIIINKLQKKETNKYFKYFQDHKELNKWLNNFIVIDKTKRGA